MNDEARARYREARINGGRERIDREQWLAVAKRAVEAARELRIPYFEHTFDAPPTYKPRRQVVHIEPDHIVVKYTELLDLESTLVQLEGVVETLEDSLRTRDRFERRICIESALGKMRYLLGLPDQRAPGVE